MKELSALEEIDWLSLGEDYDPHNMAPTNALVAMRTTIVEGGAVASYEPRGLDWPFGAWIPFRTWWRESIVISEPQGGIAFRRMNLVQMLANRDGGVHVGRLSSEERRLANNEFTGWRFGTRGNMEDVNLSPVPASVRAIGTEVLATITKHFPGV